MPDSELRLAFNEKTRLIEASIVQNGVVLLYGPVTWMVSETAALRRWLEMPGEFPLTIRGLTFTRHDGNILAVDHSGKMYLLDDFAGQRILGQVNSILDNLP